MDGWIIAPGDRANPRGLLRYYLPSRVMVLPAHVNAYGRGAGGLIAARWE